jgi:hypothetical protein
MQDITYRICRDHSDKQWPEVIRERLDPNGPSTRLIDVEDDHPHTAIIRAQKAALFPDSFND